MKAKFSEFSFGFALTHELVTVFPRLSEAVPTFPSLREEGREGGWDVRLSGRGFFVFLQFKLSDYMVRESAKQWPQFNRPYFRFPIMPSKHSNQHELLLKCERSSPTHFVYYAAPAFNFPNELNDAFLHRRAVSRTAFVRPSSIGNLPDNNEHYIAFDGPHNFYRYSEPVQIENTVFGANFYEELHERANNVQLERFDDEAFIRLSNRLKQILFEEENFSAELLDSLDSLPPAERAVYLTRTFFDSELLLLYPDERSSEF